MPLDTSSFRALVARRDAAGITIGLEQWRPEDLDDGELTIAVEYSTVNYKDGLVLRPGNAVARKYPLIPGVDLAGRVLESSDVRIQRGDAVIVHGFELGTSHHGGFADVARVPSDWAVRLPDGLSAFQAMALGTAGFTAALSIERLEHYGTDPKGGPVLVTGASGGVGSTAVAMLAARGYSVVASTGSLESHTFLRGLGAERIVDRQMTSAPSDRPLGHAEWAAAVDCVGGSTLAYVLRTLRYGGCVAASGLTGGSTFESSVMPFILRGVSLVGIDAVHLPMDVRQRVWQRVATDLRPPQLDTSIAHEVRLEDVPRIQEEILRGGVEGRVVVCVQGE
jgi:acrylyl-CoA reductase (NADPH)